MGGVSAKPLSAAWTPVAGFCALDQQGVNINAITIPKITSGLFRIGMVLIDPDDDHGNSWKAAT
jgi:hypothetical protein